MRRGLLFRLALSCSGLLTACHPEPAGPGRDTTSPTVSLMFLGCCPTKTGATVALIADAQDNVGVARVEFLAKPPRATTYSVFHVDSAVPFEAIYPDGGFTSAQNGTHDFIALAFDAAGNMGTSNSTYLTIDIDTTPPQVTVVPKATQLTTPGTLILEVQTNEVGKVELYDNGVKIDSITATVIPYIFTESYGPADNGSHLFTAKVTDNAGNVGTSPAVSFPIDIRWQWVVSPGDAGVEAAAVDGVQSVYVGGGASGDGFIAKLNADGQVLWHASYGDPTNQQAGHSVAVDRTMGDAYLAGDTYVYGARPESQCFLAKFDAAGSPQWSREVGDTLSEQGGFVATDGAGGVYLAGSTWGSINGNPNQGRQDAFVVKFNRSGDTVWSRQIGSTGGRFNDDQVYAIAVDPASGVYIAGTTDGNMEPGYAGDGYKDAWIAKFDLDGNLLWRRQLGAHGADDYIQGITAAPSGDVYVSGWNRGGLDGDQVWVNPVILIAKYSADGTRQWVHQLRSTVLYVGERTDYATGVVADTSGAYFTGMTYGNLEGNAYQGFDDAILVKYSPTGDLQWARTLGADGYDEGWGIAVDNAAAYIAGLTGGVSFVAKHPLR